MKKTVKRLALVLTVVMILSVLSGCKRTQPDTGYTYRSYTTALGTNWNRHTWETNGDRAILSYLETPLVTMSVKDSEEGIYQWVYKAADSVTDVTKDHKEDLIKYQVTLPAGQTAEQTEKGYVFEIKLNPEMKWENGTPINADTYIYSMKALLDPTMMNYRANLYYNGESAVAGAYNYYYALSEGIYVATPYDKLPSGQTVYVDAWALGNGEGYQDEKGNPCPQYIPTDDATVYFNADKSKSLSGKDLWNANKDGFVSGKYSVYVYKVNENYNANYADTYDATVGCYKVDDYTIRYVTQAAIDINYFLTSCTSNWLVYKDLYEAGFDTTGALKTTNYATSKETTMSYGPYKIESLQKEKQIVFVQNENYYQFTKNEDGTLTGTTDYEVDGQKVTAYQTTKIIIDQMTDEAAKQAFMKGELTLWTPPADEMSNYTTSEQMYQVDETYTMSLFFNTDIDALKTMDTSKGNRNSVVLSNYNFRKAFSLAIDRADWVTATPGYKPAYALMNNLYFYDVYNDPTSYYRTTPQAMQAICDLYGVRYGEGTVYATLEDAYKSVNGYNLTEAKRLMKTAHDELVAAGLYRSGEEIRIRIGWSKGAMGTAEQNQVAKLNQYLNAAVEGSGFGRVILEGIDNIPDRYADVPRGEYAIGYGAWGGAAFYPFRNLQVYCDTDLYKLHEAACWDPAVAQLTIRLGGEDVTMTWQDWSRALVGTGRYADADFDTKLTVTATMEKEFLNKYYRIPLAGSCVASLLSYQAKYFVEEYNVMYEFGGIELLTYNYNNAQWADYVKQAGGTLRYE